MIRVFTKYDAIPNTLRTLREREWGDIKWDDGMMGLVKVVDYEATRIEEGLEGVRFIHYEERA